MKKRLSRPLVIYLALAVLALVVGAAWLRGGSSPKKLTLDEYESNISNGQVADATLKDQDHKVVGKLADGTSYTVSYPEQYADELTTELTGAHVKLTVDQQKESIWLSLLFTLLPILLLVGFFFLIMNSMQGGGRVLQFGKARAKQHGDANVKVTFDDVAGCDEAVEELQEIKEFLENPARFQAMGAKIPKGVLLYGPPGTGKTLLARAVAGEAGVPFFSISGSDFVEMFVGVGASRVRDLFDQAKQTAPAIVFVDEIDAVGRHRGAGLGGGHDEREQTLNQLLVEMDGFDPRAGVILIAATNRPDILDPALLRPGRFDRQIVVDKPDIAGRTRILEVHAKGKPLAEGVNLETLAKRTPGFTGADLANLLNEAALLSARRNLEQIGMMQLEEAIDRVLAGPERRSRVISEKEKRVIAYHEAGHALVGHVMPDGDNVHKVSIVSHGHALGLTWFLPEDRYTHSRAQLRAQMASALGGRSAEELVFGEVTTGAANDIEKCTEIAKAMVTQYGMSLVLGPRKFGQEQGEVFLGRDQGQQRDYSDDVAAQIDSEVNMLIEQAHEEALAILVTHRATLDALANALVERETVDDSELAELFKDMERWEGTPPHDEPVESPARGATHADSVTRHRSPARARGAGDAVASSRQELASSPETERTVTQPEPVSRLPLPAVDQPRIERAVREILEAIGEDPEREGLVDTPARVARMYAEIFEGMRIDPSEYLKTQFETDHDEMVMVRDITMYSACEHHLLPWVGKAHVAYIPSDDGRVTGLSKLARLVDAYAKRPQVQERLTSQIADELDRSLMPKGVMVVIEAEHLCMTIRGIRKPGATTVTSAVRGLFRQNVATREEAMRFIHGR